MAAIKKVCTACGESKRPNMDFYLSRSKLYKFNNGKMPICKECLKNLFKELNAKYSDETKALYHLCMLFDIHFSKKLIEESSSNGNFGDEDNLIKNYMKNINSLNQYKFKNSLSSDCIVLDDSLINEVKENNEICEDIEFSIPITPKVRRRWGKGYTDEEYEDLEYFYEEYKNNLDHENDFMKLELIQEMCTIKFIRDKAKRNGDYKTAREYSDLLSKKMADANLKPSQQKILGEADDDIFGMKLLIYERDEPVPDVLPEYKDVDKFWGYLVKNMIKPFANALGLASGEYSTEEGSDNVVVDDKVKDALKVNHNED